jgi:methionyl-tRNA synthetase
MNSSEARNKYLAETQPWKLKKTDEKRTETIINVAIQISASLAFLCEPFLPHTSKKLKKLLNLKESAWDKIDRNLVAEKHKINKHEHLFQKIEDHEIEDQLKKLNS